MTRHDLYTEKYFQLIEIGKYNEALDYLVSLAEKNVPGASYGVGAFYEVGGEGVPQDIEASIKWYKRAIECENDTDAKLALACVYRNIGDIEFPKALELFEQAARDNSMGAHFALGVFYYSGRETGVKDLKKSKFHLQKAVEAGHVAAKIRLAVIYLKEHRYIKGLEMWFSGVKDYCYKVKGNRDSELIKFR